VSLLPLLLLLLQDVKLPYPVLHAKGTGKYDKATKVLTVTLPVVPPPFIQRSFTAAPSLIQETESSTAEAASTAIADTTSSSSGSSSTAAAASSTKCALPSEVKVVPDHSRWVQEAAPSKKFDFLLQQQKLKAAQHAPISSATDSTTTAATTATTDGPTDGAAAATTAAATAASDSSVASSSTTELNAAVSSNTEFIASATWQGSRAGYVFKKGGNGQGYYRDAPTASATATADTAASEITATAAAATTAAADSTTTTGSSDAEHVYDSALHQQQQQQQKLFKWRENERTVSIVVDVAGIDAGSVQADWQQHSISISASVTPPAAAAAAATAAAAVKESLRLRLALHGAIDTARCRYDVASRNMAVVLYKAVPGFWGQLESTAANTTTSSSTVSGGSKGTTAAAAAAAASTVSAAPQVQQGAVALPDLTALPFKNEAMYELD
jgi:HSP20 family molecular chaperone IbpA